jgi:type IV pilus biogenesis protein CpaD/CtpE
MIKRIPNISAKMGAVVLLVAALPLSGCALDDLTKESALEPYGGSKTHPIHVRGNQAMVEDCGQWPEDLTTTDHNLLHANHGCAVQSNIAAMAAYPQDLVQPRRRTLPPAEPRVGAARGVLSGDKPNVSPIGSGSGVGTP